MYDTYANSCAATVATGGYTAGSGVLNVSGTASPWPQISAGQQFRVSIFDAATNALKVILLVTGINSSTQWAVTAEGTDANASAGDNVLGCLTAGAMDNIRAVDILSPDKVRFGGKLDYSKGKGYTLNSGNSVVIYSKSGTSGYVTNFWAAIASVPTGYSWTAGLIIVVDGVTIFNNALSAFAFSPYWTDPVYAPFENAYITSTGGLGAFIPIPFNSSISITLENLHSSAHSVWWDVVAVVDVPNNWLRSKQLHVAVNSVDGDGGFALTQDQTQTLFNATGLNPGRLLGLGLACDGYAASGPAFLEGAIDIYADGNLVYKSSGTEDYFRMAGYFNVVSAGYGGPFITCVLKRTSAPLYAAIRFHEKDPILFENALRIDWHAGDSSSGNSFTGTVHTGFTAFFYTE